MISPPKASSSSPRKPSKSHSESSSSSSQRGQTATKPPKTATKNQGDDESRPSPTDVEYWKGEALHQRPLDGCSPRILTDVAEKVREERDNLVSLGLYQDSVQANEAYAKTVEYKEFVQKRDVQHMKQDDLQARLKDAQEYQKKLEEMVSKQEPNMIEYFENEQNELFLKQEDELQRLTIEWESPQKKRLYNRSSAALRNLRTQSILLLNSHRFDEMEVVDRQANEMEAKESIKNQQKLESDFQEALNKMLDRHQEELKKLKVAQKVQADKYEAAKKHDFMISQRRIEKLMKELEESNDPEKVWMHYQRREAKGPPGKRPTARAGRKNCLKAINTADFNTLNLPPLVDPRWNEPEIPQRKERIPAAASMNLSSPGDKAVARTPRKGRK